MKKIIKTISLILVLLTAVASAGCKRYNDNIVDITVDVITPVPATELPTDAPTEVPTEHPTEAPTELPTEAPTEAPTDAPAVTEAPKPGDQSAFDDAAFIGNSFFVGLHSFGVITHGKFFTKVGLNVSTVFTDVPDGCKATVMDELKAGSFGKVVIYLGTNELGWPYLSAFIEKYSTLLDAVWERQPEAKIFIVGILPVTKAYSDGKGQSDGVNNENIVKMNAALEQLASERGAIFIDVPQEMYDKDGALPADATSEGVHPNLVYDKLWAAHILQKVTDAQ